MICYFITGYEIPCAGDGCSQQNTYEEIDNVVKPISLNAKTKTKRNNEAKQRRRGNSTDEPRGTLHQHPLYQNQNTTERPIPLTELASYINHMTKTRDGFKKDFEVRSYDDLPKSESLSRGISISLVQWFHCCICFLVKRNVITK